MAAATAQDPLVVTLVYTDPPGKLQNGSVLVNDLDLIVDVTPILADMAGVEDTDALPRDRAGGLRFYGNEAAGGDRVNNAEQVRLVLS